VLAMWPTNPAGLRAKSQRAADAAGNPVSTIRVGVASKQVWDSERVVFGAKASERLGGDNA
jgi:hypothetical protein